ncbi:MAG: sigma-70 family RNA polymerase sigma factor [Firmicutes bacterium]|nr:sigma-70 family RNA polymerase sigma factor [Bacillota bacterium]MDD4264211.1 sigma-70 family RNA polymerase sigma factor [Bacillota bacterium]MDD4694449.1 sigma-70 family RNA polymerase sigma factor [Bacillota bacterium]
MYSLQTKKLSREQLEKEIQRLIDLYGEDVLRTSYMYLKDLQKAEDVFQEVFIKVFNKYETFQGKSSEKTWIIQITINLCKDTLRSSWLKRALLTDKSAIQDALDWSPSTESQVVQSVENKLLFSEVLNLPTVFKDVVLLYYYHSYDTKEISAILKIKEGTVRSRLYRARKILKDKLEGRIDFDGSYERL